ncbi:MAG TPA: hypothetical protein VG318_00385 [Actinomycetota bacterium]|nr:hypothetical protein [Actinomycetota bacterium]
MNSRGHIAASDLAELGSSLTHKWAQIERYYLAGQARVAPTGIELDDGELDLLKTWANLFNEEIDAVRQVRDFVVHLSASAVSVPQLVEANEFADRLLRLLVARLPKLRDHVGLPMPASGEDPVR